MLKKLGTSIILLFILAGVLSPYVFGVVSGTNNFEIKRNIAQAVRDTAIELFNIEIDVQDIKSTSARISIKVISKANGNYNKYENILKKFIFINPQSEIDTHNNEYPVSFSLRLDDLTPSTTSEDNTTPRDTLFKTISGLSEGTEYNIRISETTALPGTSTFFPEIKKTFTTETGTGGSNATQLQTKPNAMPPCGMGIMGEASGTFTGCIAQGLYYAVFVPTSWLIIGAGFLLDFALAYSIDSNSYSGTTFVSEGWKLVRDISNILFILILIYTGISIMFNLNSGDKKKIFTIVIIAILINFSLFFSKVIIDTGNIIAKTLYFNIQPTYTNGSAPKTVNFGTTKAKPLSAILIGKFNPQQIILNANNDTVTKTGIEADGSITASNKKKESELGVGAFILIVLLATTLNVVGAYVFFTVAFLFIIRVIGLWFMMIFSPLAFISYTLPNKMGGKLGSFGHDKWWAELVGLSFLAPVFIFFMYLIALFLDTDFLKFDSGTTLEGMMFLMGIIIPFIFIAILLIKAKDTAKQMSGEIGKQMVAVAEKAGGYITGAAVGVATGGAALLGRATIGVAGSKIAENDKLKEMEAGGGIKGFGAKMALKTGAFFGKSSYDARSTMLGKTAEKAGFTASPKGLGLLNLDEKSGAGGHKKVKEDKVKKYEERMKYLEISDDEYDKKKDKAKSNAVLKAVKDNRGNPLDEKTKEKVEKDAITALGTKNDLNMARKSTYANTLAKSTPVVTTVGHMISEGTIDKSAQRSVASKFGREVSGYNSKQDDIKKDIEKKEKEVERLGGSDGNGGEIKKVLDQQAEIQKEILKINNATDGKIVKAQETKDKANEIMTKLSTKFDDLKNTHGGTNKEETVNIAVTKKQDIINNVSSDIRLLESMSASNPTNNKIKSDLTAKINEKSVHENEMNAIKKLITDNEKAEKKRDEMDDKLESYNRKVVELNSQKETAENRVNTHKEKIIEHNDKIKELKGKLKGGGGSEPKTP